MMNCRGVFFIRHGRLRCALVPAWVRACVWAYEIHRKFPFDVCKQNFWKFVNFLNINVLLMCNHLLSFFFFIIDWKNKLSIHIDLLSIFRLKGEAWYRMPKTSIQWRHEMNYLIVASVEKLFVIIVLNTFFCLFLNFKFYYYVWIN